MDWCVSVCGWICRTKTPSLVWKPFSCPTTGFSAFTVEFGYYRVTRKSLSTTFFRNPAEDSARPLNFIKFMKHAIRLSVAFQIVYNGPNRKRSEFHLGKPKRSGNSEKSGASPPKSDKGRSGNRERARKPPFCPHKPCKDTGSRHWIFDCTDATDAEKSKYLSEIAAAKARTGPSNSTRSRMGGNAKTTGSTDDIRNKPNTGRMSEKEHKVSTADPLNPAFTADVSDGCVSLSATGKCDGGSNNSLVSPHPAEKAAISEIGKIKGIRPVEIQVALRKGDRAQSFRFSRIWTVPGTVLQLASGQLALANLSFLVADDQMTCEELIIGLPVLGHLQVDTRTLLENNRAVLDGSDCSQIGNPCTGDGGGVVSRMMSARMNCSVTGMSETEVDEQISATRPRVNYYSARLEKDPFPDPSLLDPIDADQHEEIKTEIGKRKIEARNNGLHDEEALRLDKIVDDHVDVFRISFYSGSPAKLRPLKIEMFPDARPAKVRLRNYSQEQKWFLSDMVKKLVEHGMSYPNPTSARACATLLVSKPGPAQFRFTIDLRSVNRFTV